MRAGESVTFTGMPGEGNQLYLRTADTNMTLLLLVPAPTGGSPNDAFMRRLSDLWFGARRKEMAALLIPEAITEALTGQPRPPDFVYPLNPLEVTLHRAPERCRKGLGTLRASHAGSTVL